MRDPGKVETRKLLMDARWRETAVTMCQTQPREVLTPLLNEARQVISEIIDKTPGLIENPNEYVNESQDKEKDENVKKEEILPEPFSWPQQVLHIFGLLQDGFSGHLDDLPGDIKMYAARLILSASEKGTLYDKKWGLEVAGITPHQVLLRLLRNAFAIKSQWLREVAYRQVARLLEIPKDIANGIRMALLSLFAEKRLNRERYTVKAHISRLDKSNEFLSILRLLLWIPIIDLILHASAFLYIFIYSFSSPKSFEFCLIISILLFISYLSLRSLIDLLFMGISKLDFPHYFLAMAGLLAKIYFLFGLIFQFPKLHFFLVLYFLTWAPTAGLSAKMGQFNHPLWWPFMPITPPLYLVKNAWVTLYWFRKNWRKVISFITIMLIVSFLYAILVALLDRYYWIKISSLTIVGLIAVTLLFAINFAWIKNWIRWLKWKRRQHTIIPGKKFLDLLAQFEMDSIRFKFINTVREKGLLEATKENEAIIENLALVIERHNKPTKIARKQKIKRKHGTDTVFDLEDKLLKTLPKSDEFAIWYKKYIDKSRTGLGKFIYQLLHPRYLLRSNQILDEIYMLLEQIRLRRRD